MKNRKTFAEYLTLLGEIHGKEISKTMVNAYFIVLEDYSDSQCIEVFQKLISTSKFFPKPADFLELLNCNQKLNAAEAWTQVMDCLTLNQKSDNILISKAVSSLGGWEYLSTLTYDELYWRERRFNEFFMTLQEKSNIDQDPILTIDKPKDRLGDLINKGINQFPDGSSEAENKKRLLNQSIILTKGE